MQVIYDTTQITSKENGSNPQPGDPCHPLVKNGHVPLLVDTNPQPIILDDQGGNIMHVSQDGVVDTLTAGANQTTKRPNDIALHNKVLVRRLTPLECARLQGFPDDYLSQVEGATDSVMYSAFGNSMTTQVMNFLGRRIDMVDKAMKKLNSNPKP